MTVRQRARRSGPASRRLLGVVLLAALAAACGEGGSLLPTGPSSASLAGTWMGWFSSVTTGTRTTTATLFQVGSVITGFWTIFDRGGSISGDFIGSVVGTTALLTLRPTSSPGCSLSVVAIIGNDRLEGSWSTTDCNTRDVGTFSLTRQ